jgi:hypothetical protein
MLFGHNSNVKTGDKTYHVQTEDRGTHTALIDTTVYLQGRVMHRYTTKYSDLLPLDAGREETLKQRVDAQHQSIVAQIRAGTLALGTSAAPRPAAPAQPVAALPRQAAPANAAASALKLELINPRTWLNGKHAMLQVAVRSQSGEGTDGAIVTTKIEGAAKPAEFSTVSDSSGNARFEFEMPPLANAEAAVVIEAFKGAATGKLRFALRFKPRVPSAS